ncbi:hypothetical protein SELMODRAFT_410930 [Selaginella moellendorffii]|uniref:Uncharacterized protein n=1 Tax=Selaginella moellendorffii TaxID=88036 RepID=D8RGB6_SELML|nr:hypothetical protein SELMODRAFT_410930 [Selaginella moellendorffii]
MASSGRRNVNRMVPDRRSKKKQPIFQYWGKVYKYQDEQNGKLEYVAVPGDIPCVGYGVSKCAAIENVRGKIELMVKEYKMHLKFPPIPSPPQKMDDLLHETEDGVQNEGHILEQELFCVDIKI